MSTQETIIDEAVDDSAASPSADPVNMVAPPTLRQQVSSAINSLTTTATALETAKTGKVDTDADMEAARIAATQANTDVATARTAFVDSANGLIEVVTSLRDSA